MGAEGWRRLCAGHTSDTCRAPRNSSISGWNNMRRPSHLCGGRGRDAEARRQDRAPIIVPTRHGTQAPPHCPGPPFLSRADLQQPGGGHFVSPRPVVQHPQLPTTHLRQSRPSLITSRSSGPGQLTTSLHPRTTKPASPSQLPGAGTHSIRACVKRTAWVSPSAAANMPPPKTSKERWGWHSPKHGTTPHWL